VNERDLFMAALQIEDPSERCAYLDEASSGQAGLRERVEALLQAFEQAGSFLQHLPQPLPVPPPGTAQQVDTDVEVPPTQAPSTVAHPQAPAAQGETVRISGYEILGQLGKGGMGVVYQARQTALRRIVALKMILHADHAGEDGRRRFQAEAEAVAQLQHPNIVQVYEVGQHDGLPYFSLEFCSGGSLEKQLGGTPWEPARAAALVEVLARAMQAAHQAGIIHRDLKPGNVLLTADGTPKITDFGLVKRLDMPGYTQCNALVGTPSYMPPEQAGIGEGGVGPAADVYALGAILYELLTGKPPFKAASAMETVFQVLREEPVPVRRLQPNTPRDIETICHKCLEKDPRKRYPSAVALAEDLQRFQHGEPVRARPVGPVSRLVKWARRRPAVAGLLAAVLLVLIAGIAGTTTAMLRAFAERDQKEQARQLAVKERDEKEEARRQAELSRQKAELAGRQARQALYTTTDEMLKDLLERQVQLTDRHRGFLKKVLAQHTAIAATTADGPEGRRIRADGYAQVGRINHQLGAFKEAEAAYREAIALLQQLADEFPREPKYRYDLASSSHHLAALLNDTGRPGGGEIAYRRGLELQKQLAEEYPDRPGYRHELAQSQIHLGSLLAQTSRPKEAEAAFHDAVALSRRLVVDCPGEGDYHQDLTLSQNNLAVLLYQTGRPKEAEAVWRDAVAACKRLTTAFASVPEYQNHLATALMNLGNLLRDTDQPKEAQTLFGDAVKISKRLAADFPNRPEFRSDLALCHYNLAILQHKSGNAKEAEAAWRDGLALQKQLARDFPDHTGFRQHLAKTLISLSNLLNDTGRPEEAEAGFRDAGALLKQLAEHFPNHSEYRQDLAMSRNNLATVLGPTGRVAEAEAAFRDGIALQKKLVADFPNLPTIRSELGGSLYNLAVLLHKTRRPQEAEAVWRDALALQQQLAIDFPKVPEYQNQLVATLGSLATLLRVTKRPKEAEDSYRKALDISKRLVNVFYRPDFCLSLGRTYNNLGILLSTTGRPKEAEAAFQEALGLWKKLVDELPNRPEFRQEMARTSNNFGVVEVNLGKPQEAEAAYQAAAGLLKQLAAEFRNHPDYRQELARTHDALSELLRATRRPKEAEAAWRDALAVRKQLVADFSLMPDYHNELAGTLVNLAFLHQQRREFSAAIALLEEARPHHETALKAIAAHPLYRQFYRNHLRVLGQCYLGLGDHARLATTAGELARLGFDPGNDTFLAACFVGRCVMLAEKDSKLDEAKRKEQAGTYTDRGMTLLRQAVDRGYKNAAQLKEDINLEPLRKRAEFPKLLAELEGKRNN
jgi:tetratricopeptide (TPR) repeat protein/predicted Ser/Thr protein kinase